MLARTNAVIMELVRFLVNRSRRAFSLALAAGLVSGALNAGILALVSTVVSGGSSRRLLIVFILLCVFVPVARILSETLMVHLVQDSIVALRSQLAERTLASPLRHLEQIGNHRLFSAFTEDVARITETVGLVPVVFINLGATVSCLVYMAWLNAWLFLGVMAFLITGVSSYRWVLSRSIGHLWDGRRIEDEVQKHFRTLVSGIKELKLHKKRKTELLVSVLRPAMARARERNITGLRTYSYASSWGQLLLFIALGLLVFVFSGTSLGNTHILVGFSLGLLYLIGPLQMIMNSLPELGRAGIAVRNLKELELTLDRQPEANAPDELPALTVPVELEVRDLSYSYDVAPGREGDQGFTVGPLNFKIVSGELVFITGGNGSGKTTLAKVLTGLYIPDQGTISLNGREITARTREWYRQSFSAVFVDGFVFDSLLGLDAIDGSLDARAKIYLGELELDGKVRIENSVFSTTELSQGQRKRLALLTAYLEDRPIYFFDEWAADQEPYFRDVFYHRILRELKAAGKAIIVISHDDRYYHVADRVLKLENGRIVEEHAYGKAGHQAPVSPA